MGAVNFMLGTGLRDDFVAMILYCRTTRDPESKNERAVAEGASDAPCGLALAFRPILLLSKTAGVRSDSIQA
ncbi:hypothetical protein B1812_13365 [Methylocystis bryophila]|uniref:Uncharacterized protein n=1 Tax=Methylocystis bryophila TaxID=655015 RepID=A0A1W6MWD4_9HYPH|nr:hypothetical protein B1812_13365 [Methylocystis bryophila]